MPGPTVGRAEVDVHADLSPFRRELSQAAALAGRQYGDDLATSLDARLRRVTRVFDRFWGSSLRGSRNDFLNFVGVVSTGIERLVGNVIGRGLGAIANSFDRLGSAIARFPSLVQFGGGFRLLADNIRGLGAGGIDGLIVQIVALVAAFNIGVSAIGFLAGGISTLAAGVTALAVGIGGALLGGMVALVPVVGALAVGITTLTVGLSELSDAQKEAFAPLSDLFSEIRSGVQEALFANLGDQVNGLTEALAPVGAVLNRVASEFSDWASDVIASIGPGGALDRSLQSLGDSIPGTFRLLLDILSSVGSGLVGLFAAATPAADRLLSAIGNVVSRFSEWVNSVEGSEAINAFLQQALNLLGSLWELAGQVGTALANLWTQGGADAAQVLLDNITELVRQFNTWVNDGGGREALLEWFRAGVASVEALAGVMGGLIELFDALDTTFTRQGFVVFLGLVTSAIGLLTALAASVQGTTIAIGLFVTTLATNFSAALLAISQAASAVWDSLILGFGLVAVAVQEFAAAVHAGVGRAITSVAGAVLSIRTSLQVLVTDISARATAARAAFQNMADRIGESLLRATQAVIDFRTRAVAAFNAFVTSVSAALQRVVVTITSFVGRAVAAFNNLTGRVRGAISNVVGALGGLASSAAAALGRFAASIAQGVSRAIASLRGFAGRAVSSVAGLPARFATLGVNMMQGLLRGIVSRGSAILEYLRSLASRAASAFAGVLGIASPSKVFAEYGRNVVEGLVLGLQDGVSEVMAATNSLAAATSFPNVNTTVGGLAAQAAASPSGVPTQAATNVGGITIVTPFANPRLVALEVMDELAARGK